VERHVRSLYVKQGAREGGLAPWVLLRRKRRDPLSGARAKMGRHDPPLSRLRTLAKALKTSVADLEAKRNIMKVPAVPGHTSESSDSSWSVLAPLLIGGASEFSVQSLPDTVDPRGPKTR
jgi:hypothetical protein